MIGCPKCGHQFEITEKENSETNDLIKQFHQRQITVTENNTQSEEDVDSEESDQNQDDIFEAGCMVDVYRNSWEREMIRERNQHSAYWPEGW